MKQLITIFAAVLIAANMMAQAPQKMSYQAVIRDASGALIKNKAVGMRISILQNSPTGTAVFIETQKPTTNVNGLISIEIGTGTVVKGGMDTIDWEKGPYFLQTETDPAGGNNYNITGTSQMLSVPYALYAASAGNGGLSNFQVFDSSSTFTVPAGISKVMVEIWGAGGGGSGSTGGNDNGHGGGAGGYGKGIYAVTQGTQIAVTVGKPGLGVAASSGTNGGNSSFGTSITSTGGNGGTYGSGGGAGGYSLGSFNITGGFGANGQNGPGTGGSAGGGTASNSMCNGCEGTSPGGGGNGSGNGNGPGGKGGAGSVIVWW